MKAIRIQIDMLYEVEDKHAEYVYSRDVNFFNDTIKKQFDGWGKDDREYRNPISFDLKHVIGTVKDGQKENKDNGS